MCGQEGQNSSVGNCDVNSYEYEVSGVFKLLTFSVFLPCIASTKLKIKKASPPPPHSDTSSASEDEGSLRRKAALSAVLAQNLQSPDYWINRSVQSSSTSSSASSTLSHGEPKTQPQLLPGASLLADVLAHTRIGTVDG